VLNAQYKVIITLPPFNGAPTEQGQLLKDGALSSNPSFSTSGAGSPKQQEIPAEVLKNKSILEAETGDRPEGALYRDTFSDESGRLFRNIEIPYFVGPPAPPLFKGPYYSINRMTKSVGGPSRGWGPEEGQSSEAQLKSEHEEVYINALKESIGRVGKPLVKAFKYSYKASEEDETAFTEEKLEYTCIETAQDLKEGCVYLLVTLANPLFRKYSSILAESKKNLKKGAIERLVDRGTGESGPKLSNLVSNQEKQGKTLDDEESADLDSEMFEEEDDAARPPKEALRSRGETKKVAPVSKKANLSAPFSTVGEKASAGTSLINKRSRAVVEKILLGSDVRPADLKLKQTDLVSISLLQKLLDVVYAGEPPLKTLSRYKSGTPKYN
jgi:hypothetical protein